MSAFFCVMLSCIGIDLETGRSPVQGIISGFAVCGLILNRPNAWQRKKLIKVKSKVVPVLN
jgi:hypothetical protein